jgi:hypothetical protein
MPLNFPGRTAETPAGLSIQAKDSKTDAAVVVMASYEAIQDHGLPTVKQTASDKYDEARFESDGTIIVLSGDCK